MFRKPLAVWLLFVLLFLPDALFAGTVDPLLRGLEAREAARGANKVLIAPAYEKLIGLENDPGTGELRVGVILHLDGALPDLSGIHGLIVGSVTGTIATARLPLRSIPLLADVSGIRHVQASTLSRPALDIAIPDARVTQVWNGSPAYTGSGVLVGVIDSGVDFTHDDFRNANGTTRLKAIWDLFGTGGTPPAGFTGGVEYTEAQINAALTGGGTVAEKDLNGHGTHVVGDAAGNARSSSGQFKGPAFQADLLFAKPFDDQNGGFPSDKTIDAMNYIVQKAQALGKPVAINMSLGGHGGSHDGTDPQEKVVDQLSGAGVIFCIAAGNEGEDFLHEAGPASNKSFVYRVPEYTPNNGTNNDFVALQIWVDGNSSPTVRVTGPGGATSGNVTGGQQFGQNTSAGAVIVDNASQGIDPNSGDKLIFIEFDDQAGTNVAAGDWTILVTGGSGIADAYKVFTTMFSGFLNSDQGGSVGIPGTAEKAVTVAAYKTRNSWNAIAGTVSYGEGTSLGQAAIGDRAPFSSMGPTRDGRQKPDVSAPGAAIVSTYSKDQNPPGANEILIPGSKYYATQGTSMATPITCGVVAQMLEKNHALTADQVRSTLRSTARTDGFTGAVWNARFGAGKVDAQAAVAAVTGGTGGGPDGDIDNDGSASVLDVVRLVNHILDPVGHALTTDQREAADVFPAGGGDGTLNASDVARIVAFILKLENPGAPSGGLDPASFAIGAPVAVAGGGTIAVRIAGDDVAAGQFALAFDDADWIAGEVAIEGGGTAAARTVGDQIRVLFYGGAESLPADGFTVRLPFRGPAPAGAPRVEGVLLADPHGFSRDVRIQGAAGFANPILHLLASPNPTSAETAIRFRLGTPAPVKLEIFDVQGRPTRTLLEETLPAGDHVATWDGRDALGRAVPAGVYLYRLVTPVESRTLKLVVRG